MARVTAGGDRLSLRAAPAKSAGVDHGDEYAHQVQAIHIIPLNVIVYSFWRVFSLPRNADSAIHSPQPPTRRESPDHHPFRSHTMSRITIPTVEQSADRIEAAARRGPQATRRRAQPDEAGRPQPGRARGLPRAERRARPRARSTPSCASASRSPSPSSTAANTASRRTPTSGATWPSSTTPKSPPRGTATRAISRPTPPLRFARRVAEARGRVADADLAAAARRRLRRREHRRDRASTSRSTCSPTTSTTWR